MSYQIKSTPFYRRMFNNSKKNGQLQRLREEYERIQEFNDRTIELKMRQVRLKRLFRQIEGINETAGTASGGGVGHRRLAPVAPTPEQLQHAQRLEALIRAKELGKEISRHNAKMTMNGVGGYLRSELRTTAKMQAVSEAKRQAMERRDRAAKRISYGNAQSKSNMQRLGQRRLRRLVAGNPQSATNAPYVIQQSDKSNSKNNKNKTDKALLSSTSCSLNNQRRPDEQKRAMLRQRLQYGNSRSNNNITRVQTVATPRKSLAASHSSSLEDEPLLEADYANNLLSNIAMATGYNDQLLLRTNSLLPYTDDSDDGEMQTAPLALERHEISPATDSNGNSMFSSDEAITGSSNKTCLVRLEDSLESNQCPDAQCLSQQMATFCCQPSNANRDQRTRALAHWHLISLTLPWRNAFHQAGITRISSHQPTSPVSQQTLTRIESSSYDDALGTSSYIERSTQAAFPDCRNAWQQTDQWELVEHLPQQQNAAVAPANLPPIHQQLLQPEPEVTRKRRKRPTNEQQ